MQVEKNVDISQLLWYKIGGKTSVLLTCYTANDILDALRYIQENKITRFLTIGQGSNLIFATKHFDGAIIRVVGKKNTFKVKETTVSCFGGEVLDDLIHFSLKNNLTGLEWAGGLPGTVGAAVRGNVGAFGGEIKDGFKEAEVASYRDGKVEKKTISTQQMQFGYRESVIKQDKNTIVLNARFHLESSNSVQEKEARKTYESNKKYRASRHPIDYPNCGSVFKNITKKEEVEKVFQHWPDVKEKALSDWYGKISMGYIIDRLGFTGKTVGGARISEKHSNFIVNTGEATGENVLQLVKEIQNSTHNEFGFTPEIEPEIIE